MRCRVTYRQPLTGSVTRQYQSSTMGMGSDRSSFEQARMGTKKESRRRTCSNRLKGPFNQRQTGHCFEGPWCTGLTTAP